MCRNLRPGDDKFYDADDNVDTALGLLTGDRESLLGVGRSV